MSQSDHLPVVVDYSIYLTLPKLANLTQPSDALVYGILKHKSIIFKYNCSLLNEIVELKQVFYFLWTSISSLRKLGVNQSVKR